MNKELEDLQYLVKRRFSFRINPQFSENFKTNIKDTQIIPLIQEVFKILDWPIVYTDNKSVEAKRKNQWNKLTAKLTVTKRSLGRIEVHSKSLEGHITDLGKNSKRTGLFIALFKKLEKEYGENGRLEELEKEFNKKNNWEDYEIPKSLPKPPNLSEPNITNTILYSILISIILGITLGLLTHFYRHIEVIYEFGAGLFIAYFLGKTLIKTNYTNFNHSKLLIIGILVLALFMNFYTQYFMIDYEKSNYNFNFLEYLKNRFGGGIMLTDNFNTGWIGYAILWGLHIGFIYIITIYRLTFTIINYVIDRIPSEVIDYTLYLFEKDHSISEVRLHLSEKGWKKLSDQDQVFEAINEIIGLQDLNRN